MVLFLKRVVVALAALTLAACASIPQDRGFGDVRQLAADRGQALPDAVAADRTAQVQDILAKPLTESDAVRVAFLNSPRIQREYARLGLSGAEVLQASRLSNPSFSAGWQGSTLGVDVSRYDFGLTQNFAELLLLPARTRLSKGDFERAKLDATQALLDLAAEVQSAYYEAAGAQQIATMRKTIATAATASADLSGRFKEAGNFTALEFAIDQAGASQALLDQEQAEADATRAKDSLNELMGLGPDARWEVASALPKPLDQEDALDELQKLASLKRADLESDRRLVALLQDNLGVTRDYRLLGSVDVGVQYERDTDRNRLLGPSLSLQLPIFSQGQPSLLRAESQLDQARADLRAKELEVANGVQAAYDRLLAARKRLDRLGKETIPLREAIVARTQERVNYMLVGVFDLLRARQDEYSAYQQYLEAVREYWQARGDLAHEVGARLPSDSLVGEPVVAPEYPVEPQGDGMGHMHHGGGMSMPGMDHSGPAANPHAGHDVPGMDMKGMDHQSPAAEADAAKAACAQLKSANPEDPLTQALKQKCQENTVPAASQKHSGHSMHDHAKPANGHSSGDHQPQ